MDDIVQIQDYLATIEEHRSEFVERKGFLVGKTLRPHLQKILSKITNVEFKPYSKLVDDCKQGYKQYIEAFESASND